MFLLKITQNSGEKWEISLSSQQEVDQFIIDHKEFGRLAPTLIILAGDNITEVPSNAISNSADEFGNTTYVLPAEYTYEVVDIANQLALQSDISSKIAAGKNAKNCCNDILAYVAGHNIAASFTVEQIMGMSTTFGSIFTALNMGMASTAKSGLSSVTVDGTLITTELITAVTAIFAQYGY